MTFQEWFNGAPHRAKYSNDHPAYLAAQEAWEAAHEACHALRQTLPNPHQHCQVSAHAYDMAIAAYGAAIRARGQS